MSIARVTGDESETIIAQDVVERWGKLTFLMAVTNRLRCGKKQNSMENTFKRTKSRDPCSTVASTSISSKIGKLEGRPQSGRGGIAATSYLQIIVGFSVRKALEWNERLMELIACYLFEAVAM